MHIFVDAENVHKRVDVDKEIHMISTHTEGEIREMRFKCKGQMEKLNIYCVQINTFNIYLRKSQHVIDNGISLE